MKTLRARVIKLAYANPDLREDLLPLLSDKEASADSLNAAIKSWWTSLAKKIDGKSGMEVKSISEDGLEIVYGRPYPYSHMRVFAEKGMIEFESREFRGASRLTMDMSQKYIADSILKIPDFMARLATTKEAKKIDKVAEAKLKCLSLIDSKIQSFEKQSRAYVDNLKEIKRDIEEAHALRRYRYYRLVEKDLEKMWSKSDDWITIRKDISDILNAMLDDLKAGHFK